MASTLDIKAERAACQHLRTKSLYVPAQRHAKLLLEDGPSTQYWCMVTMGPVGPDENVVCPSECSNLRSCFKS